MLAVLPKGAIAPENLPRFSDPRLKHMKGNYVRDNQNFLACSKLRQAVDLEPFGPKVHYTPPAKVGPSMEHCPFLAM